jgi:hypothetical protein
MAWQTANADSWKIFGQKMEIKPAQVLEILTSAADTHTTVCLMPRDPCAPLSVDNFCLTTRMDRRFLLNKWGKLKCKEAYCKFLTQEKVEIFTAFSTRS